MTATPKPKLAHLGLFTRDMAPMLDFYTGPMGLTITDEGTYGDPPARIVFMSNDPFEHHQFVLAGGRSAEKDSTVGETGFKAPDLAALRGLKTLLEAEPDASDITTVDHGICWTLYFRDPEGIRCSVSVDTTHHVPQPTAWPLDLSLSDADIIGNTARRAREIPGSMPREDWQGARTAQFSAEGRLTMEGEETGNANPDFPRPHPERVLLPVHPLAARPPAIAQAHCGFKVSDMEAMITFYDKVLGYAVTDRGTMPAIGAEPEREYTYLSRDPNEHHQVILVSGRDMDAPSSVNQLSLRIMTLDELRRMEAELEAHPAVGPLR